MNLQSMFKLPAIWHQHNWNEDATGVWWRRRLHGDSRDGAGLIGAVGTAVKIGAGIGAASGIGAGAAAGIIGAGVAAGIETASGIGPAAACSRGLVAGSTVLEELSAGAAIGLVEGSGGLGVALSAELPIACETGYDHIET